VKQGYRNLFAFVALTVAILTVLFVGQTSAQVISGDLVGTVLDKSGAAVPNASVEAVNSDTGAKYNAQADDTGAYRFNNLPAGNYNISAWASNFAKTTVNGFRVELNKTSTLPVTLEIKGAVTSIEVSGATVALDTTTATVSNTFDSKLSSDLPAATTGSGVLNLSLLGSGVASSGGIGAGSGPSVGGQRPRNNNFTIEGVDNNSKSVTGPLVGTPNDAVEEFSVLQNQFSPEFGHSSGGQFNTIVKSGTNSYHGGAYIYSKNRNFNAVDPSLKNQGIPSNPRFDNNRIGGDVGGPILKNKLFFFGLLEYNPVGQASVSASALCAPTAAGYTTLGGIPGVSATNLGVLQKYAGPAAAANNCPAVDTTDPRDPTGKTPNSLNQIFIKNAAAPGGFTPVDVGIIPVQAPNYTNNWSVVGSMDYNISTSDQLRGRYIYNRAVGLDNSPSLPVFFTPLPTKNHLVTINEYHTFRPNLTNEFRVGFNRFTQVIDTGNFSYPGLDSFPNLEFFDLNLQLGADPNGPQFTIQNLYQAADSLTWTKGHHTLKFGIEGRKYISPQSFTQRSRGDYDYTESDLFLRDQTPDFLAERSLGNPVYYGDQSAVYFFINDDWRIRPNLTLNLGVRYEYTTIQTGERVQSLNEAASVPGLISFAEPKAPKNNWGPRIGIAYSPGTSGRTSIRAGAGIAYDVLYDNIGILSLPPQLSGTVDCNPYKVTPDPGCPVNGSFLANGGIPPTNGIVTFPDIASQRAATANHVVVDQLSPKSIQWTLGVQHTFWKDYTVEVRYLGTRGIHLNTQERINKQTKITSTEFLPTYTQNPGQAALDALTVTLAQITANSNFVPAYKSAGFNATNLVQFTPNGDSIYHGLATQVTKRMSHGLQFIGSYTWSHTIDDSTADFFSTVLTPRRTQDFQNLGVDRSNSALDRRHRFTMAMLYDVPFFQHHSNWAVKNIIGNWEIAPVYTYQTGEWATVESNRDANLNGDAAGDRTIFNASGIPGTGTDVTALKNTGGATVAYLANDPTAQYIRAGSGARADVGRNTLLTRPINNFDVTAVKRISITERYKVEFSANAFNVLNHPQFIPGLINDVASFGITSTATSNYLTPGNAVFNKPELVFPGNARTLQLGLKFKF
jgi:hypothetical protein